MKRFSEQLHKEALTIKLRLAERKALRERVISYMEYHPLPESARTPAAPTAGLELTEAVSVVKLNLKRVLQWSGAIAGIFILSVTYIAERSVPGDTLYAIKVGVNEELRSTLARTSYDKVVWETERLNRRIAEARLLASEGKLTEEVEERVALAVRTHSDNARREINVLQQTDREGAALATLKLSTTLDVQSATMRPAAVGLMSASLGEPTSGQMSDRIASAISASQAAEAELVVAELPSYDRLTARLEQESTRAYELLASVKKLASNGEQADIKRRMEDIARSVVEAVALQESDEVATREGLLAALQRTHRLIIFMTNIDVRANVSVEEIVPVTLTREERVVLVRQNLVKVERLLTQLSPARLPAVETAVLEKVELAATEGNKVAQAVAEALAADEYDVAALEAQLATVLPTLTDAVGLLPVSELEVEETETATSTATTTVTGTSTATTTEETATSTANSTSSATSSEENLTEV